MLDSAANGIAFSGPIRAVDIEASATMQSFLEMTANARIDAAIGSNRGFLRHLPIASRLAIVPGVAEPSPPRASVLSLDGTVLIRWRGWRRHAHLVLGRSVRPTSSRTSKSSEYGLNATPPPARFRPGNRAGN